MLVPMSLAVAGAALLDLSLVVSFVSMALDDSKVAALSDRSMLAYTFWRDHMRSLSLHKIAVEN